ncbi:hypothetical protein [Comamonas sp. 26]|uniref:hypothetical protein n=1 Tax=Comamonas sp. 26 TaxID=2035201 RepID=UPI000C175AEB|nr:hypothetical protein [Comamonas sp. 26]PIG09487.1 hypothetical protein CLU84_2398 [Comamonas sp. 26]
MTPYDKQFIEQRLADVAEDINALIAICGGRQKFSPGDKEQVRYGYENLKSKLRGLAIHAFGTEEGRNFCDRAGGDVLSALTAKVSDSPEEITRCLHNSLDEVSYRLDRLSKYAVAD